MNRFIDQYDILILDVGQTFMFNVDRFSPNDNLGLTYLELGGRTLEQELAAKLCIDVFREISEASLLPENYERLPSVKSCIDRHPAGLNLPERERSILERTIALHEIGEIPEEYCTILRKLRKSHRLGIVSDIWSKSDLFYEKFRDLRILELFEVIIFSSDIGLL